MHLDKVGKVRLGWLLDKKIKQVFSRTKLGTGQLDSVRFRNDGMQPQDEGEV